MKKYFQISVFVSAMTLGACSGNPLSTSKPQLVAEPDPVNLMIADAAKKAAMSLETLAAIEDARMPAQNISTIPDVPAELARGISVEWTGPAAPLVKAVAAKASYEFVILGDTPAIVPIVSVDAKNKKIIDVLRDIGLQLGTRADVSVDAQSKRIELQYAPVVGAADRTIVK